MCELYLRLYRKKKVFPPHTLSMSIHSIWRWSFLTTNILFCHIEFQEEYTNYITSLILVFASYRFCVKFITLMLI